MTTISTPLRQRISVAAKVALGAGAITLGALALAAPAAQADDKKPPPKREGGTVQFEDIHVSKEMDKATTKLAEAAA